MAQFRLSRRGAVGLLLGSAIASRQAAIPAQVPSRDWVAAPIGWPDQAPGAGFQIGHGFACENTWFAAGWWHTGEDWYAVNGDSAGASVYAIAAGEVVYADFNYPGRVVIIQHAEELFSMYGHLDPADLNVQIGQQVAAGDLLGVVMRQAAVRGPGQAPSHLHLELRTFLTRDDVNGTAPQHGVNCGFQCPPGPGYWPMMASEHPAELGWRNPLLGRLRRVETAGLALRSQPGFVGQSVDLRGEPNGDSPVLGELDLAGDTELMVSEVVAGEPDSTETSAEAYAAWFRVEIPGGTRRWVQGVVPSVRETGSDGRPSAVDLPFVMEMIPNS